MKRWSTSLTNREMQNKFTVRYHFIPTKMTIIKRQKVTSTGEDVAKLKPFIHCWWECKTVQWLGKTLCQFLRKLNIELYHPAMPRLRIYPKELKTCTQMFIVALFIIDKRWEQRQCPSTDEWIKKMWYNHTIVYYLAIKMNEVVIPSTRWMNLENMMLSERIWTQKNTYSMIPLVWTIQKR